MRQDLQIQHFATQSRIENESLDFHHKVACLLSLSAHQSTRLITVTQTYLDMLMAQPFCAKGPLSQWQHLLLAPGETLKSSMLEDSSMGKLLRRNTPFVYLRPTLDAVANGAWTPWAQVFMECVPRMDQIMQVSREKIVFKGKQRFRIIQGGLSTEA